MLYRRVDAFQDSLGGQHAHLAERLFDGRQAGVLKCGALNVVETDDGNIIRYAPACLAQSLNRADRRNVIERKKSRERLA